MLITTVSYGTVSVFGTMGLTGSSLFYTTLFHKKRDSTFVIIILEELVSFLANVMLSPARLSSVCLSVVCNARAPYSGGCFVLVVWTIIWRHLLNELLYILALCQYTPFDYTQG